MKKSILKLGKALKKQEQANIFGERSLSLSQCSYVCPTATSGTKCFNGSIHCPAECNGHGGWISY